MIQEILQIERIRLRACFHISFCRAEYSPGVRQLRVVQNLLENKNAFEAFLCETSFKAYLTE